MKTPLHFFSQSHGVAPGLLYCCCLLLLIVLAAGPQASHANPDEAGSGSANTAGNAAGSTAGNTAAANSAGSTMNQAAQGTYRQLLSKAEAGQAEAQTQLGLMRLQGELVERDLKIARVWLGKAAVQNYAPAQYYLGQLLLLDVFDASPAGLQQQLAEGLGWLRRAARDQHQAAQLLYSRTILESQLESPFNHSKVEAQQHLDACAQTHLPCTRYLLGRLDHADEESYCPTGASCNDKRALLHILANNGDAEAHYRLSRFETEDSLYWLRRAARLGHAPACLELANLVLENQTQLQPEDPALLALLDTAAQQGNAQAMYLLGSLLHEGTRFPVNKRLGIQWIEQAAGQGYQPASTFLAQIRPTANRSQSTEQVESVQPTMSTP